MESFLFLAQAPTMPDIPNLPPINQSLQLVKDILISFGFKIVGAILFWFVGGWLINQALNLMSKALRSQGLERTIATYLTSTISVTLKIVLIVAILGFLGVETTSFAALLAAAGIAIGAACGGLLANFAAGVFLILFRPFAVGDFIEGGGVVGEVKEIGLFVTTINTLDNVKTIVGNNKLFSDNIQNFSANPYRRVDLVAQLNGSVDVNQAINLLKERLSQIPNVLSDPTPDVEILEFNFAGPVLAVRPYCNNAHYWQVYFDTNKTIRETFGEAGYPAPAPHYTIHQV